jgi:hypothetical protein
MASIIRFQYHSHFDCHDIGCYNQYGGSVASAYSRAYPNDRNIKGAWGKQLEYSKNISIQCVLFDSSRIILGESHWDIHIITATAFWNNQAQPRKLLCK